MRLTRRDFFKIAGAVGITTVLPLETLTKALAGNGLPRVIWLQGQSCTGCSVSLLNSVNITTIDDVLINKINMDYHSNLIASAGDVAISRALKANPSPEEIAAFSDEWLLSGPGLSMDFGGPGGTPDNTVNLYDFSALTRQGYILAIEGAIPTGGNGHYCHIGGGLSMIDALGLLGAKADAILAVGTCAAFGGIAAASPNLTGAKSVSDALSYLGISKTVINIPGCPIHPDWFVGTVVNLLAGNSVPLDANQRPLAYFGASVHNTCSNLSNYNSSYAPQLGHAGAQSCLSCHSRGDTDVPNPRTLGMTGCLYALGCKGKQTYGDCATRKWNNPGPGQAGVNWCIGARTPCHGCTQPNFPDGMAPFYTLTD